MDKILNKEEKNRASLFLSLILMIIGVILFALSSMVSLNRVRIEAIETKTYNFRVVTVTPIPEPNPCTGGSCI